MKKYIFLRNKKFRPSSYYRIYQYIDLDNIEDIYINEYESDIYYKLNKKKNKTLIFFNKLIFMMIIGYFRRIKMLLLISFSNADNIILVQREVFPKYIGILGKKLLEISFKKSNCIYWEFDDNIICDKEITDFERNMLMKYSNKIIVGNKFLKNLLPKKYQEKIEIVNTTDIDFLNFDIKNAIKIRRKSYKSRFNIVWLGTDVNLIYLEKLIFTLDEIALISNKCINLKIICNKNLNYKTKYLNIINIRWDRDIALRELVDAHIGLMPLEDNEYTRGKCSFKAIQYMGAGIPIAISPVGMNKEIVLDEKNGIFINDMNDFKNKILRIIDDSSLWNSMSEKSREIWEEKFNPKKVGDFINSLIDI